ncbi:MAG: hypothetical protein HYV59_11290 [Planctomycetes bacterium]|nr:hypothetical protein [Planctomycetota bacterium]
MINRPTVFILGAGGSIPYNYPSGNKLVEDIIASLLKRQLLFQLCSKLEFTENEIIKFANALKFSGDASIDAFLERNPNFVDLGKIAITLTLIEKENTGTLFSEGNDKWYGDLLNELKSPSINDFKNSVAFLTFNYDRSFEHYVYTSIKNSYGISDKECTEIINTIPIIHLHGQTGKLPWQVTDGTGRPYDNNFPAYRTIVDSLNIRANKISARTLAEAVHYIRRISNQIKIIHEADVEKDIEFKEAHKLLSDADKIYFLGFGYNDENLRRLKISELPDIIIRKTPSGEAYIARIITGTNCGIGTAKTKHITSVSSGKIMLPEKQFKVLEFIKEFVNFD